MKSRVKWVNYILACMKYWYLGHLREPQTKNAASASIRSGEVRKTMHTSHGHPRLFSRGGGVRHSTNWCSRSFQKEPIRGGGCLVCIYFAVLTQAKRVRSWSKVMPTNAKWFDFVNLGWPAKWSNPVGSFIAPTTFAKWSGKARSAKCRKAEARLSISWSIWRLFKWNFHQKYSLISHFSEKSRNLKIMNERVRFFHSGVCFGKSVLLQFLSPK